MTFYNLVGAVIFLALGILMLALANRAVYPALRWRYETAKTTQTQGIDPKRVMTFVWLLSLVVLPVIGFYLGDSMKRIFG
ncbi:MAG: hypothetical protein U1F47_13110 [Hyphomicrobiales bacterium]|jgi:uncharacterized membrane protein